MSPARRPHARVLRRNPGKAPPPQLVLSPQSSFIAPAAQALILVSFLISASFSPHAQHVAREDTQFLHLNGMAGVLEGAIEVGPRPDLANFTPVHGVACEFGLDGALDKLLAVLAHTLSKQAMLPNGLEVVVQHAGAISGEEVGDQLWNGSVWACSLVVRCRGAALGAAIELIRRRWRAC